MISALNHLPRHLTSTASPDFHAVLLRLGGGNKHPKPMQAERGGKDKNNCFSEIHQTKLSAIS